MLGIAILVMRMMRLTMYFNDTASLSDIMATRSSGKFVHQTKPKINIDFCRDLRKVLAAMRGLC